MPIRRRQMQKTRVNGPGTAAAGRLAGLRNQASGSPGSTSNFPGLHPRPVTNLSDRLHSPVHHQIGHFPASNRHNQLLIWKLPAAPLFRWDTAFTIVLTVLPKLGRVGTSAIMNVEPVFAPVQVAEALLVVATVVWLGLRRR
jgi:hypothetical protein